MDYLDFRNVVYTGERQNNEPHGKGVMQFPSGEKYTGGFECGEFHGEGELETKDGKVIGTWDHGKLLTYRVVFADGLEFNEGQWDYITPSDRRFYNEVTKRVPVAASRESPEDFPDEESIKNAGRK